jgi:hypothetical protein
MCLKTAQAQNSYDYNRNDWAKDIADAQAIGIDGFGMRQSWYSR